MVYGGSNVGVALSHGKPRTLTPDCIPFNCHIPRKSTPLFAEAAETSPATEIAVVDRFSWRPAVNSPADRRAAWGLGRAPAAPPPARMGILGEAVREPAARPNTFRPYGLQVFL